MSEKKTRLRVTPIFIGVSIFIILVVGLINYELSANKTRVVDLYNDIQSQNVESLALVIRGRQEGGASDEDLKLAMPGLYSASGSRYLVFECDGEIVFAKTLAMTDKLYNNKNADNYWNEVSKTNIQTSKSSWEYNDKNYAVTIVTETSDIYEGNNLVQHDYYILLTIIIVCIVLFSMLITYVGLLDRTTRNLNRTKSELQTRNTDIENYLSEGKNQVVKNPNAPHTDSEFEKSYASLDKFLDASVLRNLISKSNSDDLKPVKMIAIKFGMTNRYYSIAEITIFANEIIELLKQREVLFEIRKGVFAVVIFKTNDAEIKLRQKTFIAALESENIKSKLFTGFETEVFELGSGENAAIEDLEAALKKIQGESNAI